MIQDLTKKILGDAQLAEMKISLPLKERISKLEADAVVLIKAVDETKLTATDIASLGVSEKIISEKIIK
jgi:hypothetical protein